MHDLPSVALLQQTHAVPRSGEDLEVFGKSAAARFINGRASSMSDAVVDTVKQAGLSPEQVKRVIEFANTAAYLHEFNKEGSDVRYVEFNGGPADPGEVLRSLNSGAGGTIFDRGSADYNTPYTKVAKKEAWVSDEPEAEKVASAESNEWDNPFEIEEKLAAKYGPFGPTGADIMQDMMGDASRGRISIGDMAAYQGGGVIDPFGDHQKHVHAKLLQSYTGRSPVVVKHAAAEEISVEDAAFEEAFSSSGQDYPMANPLQEAMELRDKLAGAVEEITSNLDADEQLADDALRTLYAAIKEASLSEQVTLGQLVSAWHHVGIEPAYVKMAFAHIGPRLLDERVFGSGEELADSLQKTASTGVVDRNHPLVSSMAAFGLSLNKIAEAHTAREEILAGLVELDAFLHKTSAALIPTVLDAARRGGEATEGAVGALMSKLVDNKNVAKNVASFAGGAVTHAPHIAGALAAKEVYDRARYNPATQYVASHIPGTQANAMRNARLMSGGMYY